MGHTLWVIVNKTLAKSIQICEDGHLPRPPAPDQVMEIGRSPSPPKRPSSANPQPSKQPTSTNQPTQQPANQATKEPIQTPPTTPRKHPNIPLMHLSILSDMVTRRPRRKKGHLSSASVYGPCSREFLKVSKPPKSEVSKRPLRPVSVGVRLVWEQPGQKRQQTLLKVYALQRGQRPTRKHGKKPFKHQDTQKLKTSLSNKHRVIFWTSLNQKRLPLIVDFLPKK